LTFLDAPPKLKPAIDLVARILLEPGDTVAVEDRGYLPVVRLLAALGATVVRRAGR
jgi:DNA-binding transcriptional MocR family regulator